jgi:hypothetical protein
MGFHRRIGSKLLIDATKGPALTDELGNYFGPVKPQGLVNIKLEGFLG